MNELRDITPNLPFDIAIEALVGLVMNNNESLSLDQLRVRPLGHLNKTAIREVLSITQSGFDRDGKELICFDINRTSLFESLPEMLFHSQGKFEDPADQAEFIARERENARTFFLPIEEEFYRSRIELELRELAALKELNLHMLNVYGFDLSDVTEHNRQQVSLFAFFLPFLNKIVGNTELTCAVLTAVVNKKVIADESMSACYELPESLHSRMGSTSLGDGLLLGPNFSDGSRCLNFSICDVNAEELEDWIPGGTMRTLLEEKLFPYILPSGENYTVTILLNNTGEGTVLGDDQYINILGYAII